MACWGRMDQGGKSRTHQHAPSHIHLHTSPLASSSSQENTCVHSLTHTHASHPSPRAPQERGPLTGPMCSARYTAPARNPGLGTMLIGLPSREGSLQAAKDICI